MCLLMAFRARVIVNGCYCKSILNCLTHLHNANFADILYHIICRSRPFCSINNHRIVNLLFVALPNQFFLGVAQLRRLYKYPP